MGIRPPSSVEEEGLHGAVGRRAIARRCDPDSAVRFSPEGGGDEELWKESEWWPMRHANAVDIGWLVWGTIPKNRKDIEKNFRRGEEPPHLHEHASVGKGVGGELVAKKAPDDLFGKDVGSERHAIPLSFLAIAAFFID